MSGEIKRISAGEHPAILGVPEVRGVAIVRVEPPIVVVVFHIEHVQVAVGVRERA